MMGGGDNSNGNGGDDSNGNGGDGGNGIKRWWR